MRVLSSQGIDAIDAEKVVLALLVEMDLDGGALYLNQSALDLVVNGITYYGVHDLGQVQSLASQSGEMPRLSFSMSGVPSDKISLALTENVQGRPVRVKLALFSVGGTLLDVSLRYSGYLDAFTIEDGGQQAVLQVTSEAGVRDLLRPSALLYSHVDQQTIAPGDLFFQFMNAQVEQKVVFPARHWFIAHPEK
jgi:hypothetical protein